MRIWLDTEFMEDGRTIDLLSIGLVRDDGGVYYAEPAEADRRKANDWVHANVVPYLGGPVKPRAIIAQELVEFANPYRHPEPPEFWAWYGAYDWIAMIQLFGTLMERPEGWPMYVRDFKQHCDEREIDTLLPHSVRLDGPKHNALSDALWLRRASLPYLGKAA